MSTKMIWKWTHKIQTVKNFVLPRRLLLVICLHFSLLNYMAHSLPQLNMCVAFILIKIQWDIIGRKTHISGKNIQYMLWFASGFKAHDDVWFEVFSERMKMQENAWQLKHQCHSIIIFFTVKICNCVSQVYHSCRLSLDISLIKDIRQYVAFKFLHKTVHTVLLCVCLYDLFFLKCNSFPF